MKELMAKCESCGREVPIAGWAMWAHGMPSADAYKRSCPYCGGWAIAQGTVYDVAGTAAQVLAATGLSEDELSSLADAITRAQSKGTIDDAVAEVATSSTLGANVLRLFVPRTPADLAAWLAVLLMVVQLIQARSEPSPPSQEDIAAIVTEALAQAGLMDEDRDAPPDQGGPR